jgi:hypothetical protein
MGHDHHRRGPQRLDVELDAAQLVVGDVEPDRAIGRHEDAPVRDAQLGAPSIEAQLDVLAGLEKVQVGEAAVLQMRPTS